MNLTFFDLFLFSVTFSGIFKNCLGGFFDHIYFDMIGFNSPKIANFLKLPSFINADLFG